MENDTSNTRHSGGGNKEKKGLNGADVKFLMEYFRGYLETNKQYRMRIPVGASILNILIVWFIFSAKFEKEYEPCKVIFVFLPVVVAVLGVVGLKAVKRSYDRFLLVIPELHRQLHSDYAFAHNAKEIWRYAYSIVVIVSFFSALVIYARFSPCKSFICTGIKYMYDGLYGL